MCRMCGQAPCTVLSATGCLRARFATRTKLLVYGRNMCVITWKGQAEKFATHKKRQITMFNGMIRKS
jgi:hypothetical protein